MLRRVLVVALVVSHSTGLSGCGVDSGADTGTSAPPVDADSDGYAAEEDCDDEDAGANPGGLEFCGDLVDNDCDGFVDVECNLAQTAIRGVESGDAVGVASAGFAWYPDDDGIGLVVGAAGADGGRGGAYFFARPPGAAASLADADAVLGSGMEWAGAGAAVAVGDLSGDGLPEIMVAAPAAGVILAYDGAPDENLDYEEAYDQLDARGIQALTIQDVNGDGANDLIVGGTAEVRLGPVGGGQQPSLTVEDDGLLRFADLDGDGILDLVMGMTYHPYLAVWFAPAFGTLVPDDADAMWQGAFGAFAVGGDATGDGRSDAVVGVPDADAAYVIDTVESGELGVLAVAELTGPVDAWTGFAVDWLPDIDMDGINEVVVGSPDALDGRGEVGLWRFPAESGPADIIVDGTPGAELGCGVVGVPSRPPGVDVLFAAGAPGANAYLLFAPD